MTIPFVWLRWDQLGQGCLSVSRGAKAGAESVQACLSIRLQQQTAELAAYEMTHSDRLRLLLLLLLRTECLMAETGLAVSPEVVLPALDCQLAENKQKSQHSNQSAGC